MQPDAAATRPTFADIHHCGDNFEHDGKGYKVNRSNSRESTSVDYVMVEIWSLVPPTIVRQGPFGKCQQLLSQR